MIDRERQLERPLKRAVAALEAMELFAGHWPLLPHAGQHEAAVAGLDVDIVAVYSGDFGGEDVRLRRFVEIDRGLPSRGPWREAVQALLDREEIAERIPACKGHDPNASTLWSLRWPGELALYLFGAKRVV